MLSNTGSKHLHSALGHFREGIKLGTIVHTPAFYRAAEKAYETQGISPHTVMYLHLKRYVAGDYGVTDPESVEQNKETPISGNRCSMAVYEMPDKTKFWIITEWDRSVTTFLLPSDY